MVDSVSHSLLNIASHPITELLDDRKKEDPRPETRDPLATHAARMYARILKKTCAFAEHSFQVSRTHAYIMNSKSHTPADWKMENEEQIDDGLTATNEVKVKCGK